jgi:copper chaperone CopZ
VRLVRACMYCAQQIEAKIAALTGTSSESFRNARFSSSSIFSTNTDSDSSSTNTNSDSNTDSTSSGNVQHDEVEVLRQQVSYTAYSYCYYSFTLLQLPMHSLHCVTV